MFVAWRACASGQVLVQRGHRPPEAGLRGSGVCRAVVVPLQASTPSAPGVALRQATVLSQLGLSYLWLCNKAPPNFAA